MAVDDYLPALPGFDNSVSIIELRHKSMKMKRPAVIVAMSVIVGLAIVGVSPAFAGSFCTSNGSSTYCSASDNSENFRVGGQRRG